MDDKEHLYEDGRPIIPTALKWLILFLCPVVWGCATAPQTKEAKIVPLHVFENDAVIVNLMPAPCVEPRSKMMALTSPLADRIEQFQALESNWLEKDGSRKDYPGCWIELSAEDTGSVPAFLVLFSDGTHDVVPKSAFAKSKGQSGV